MPDSLDSLQIELKASSQSASNQIEVLSKKLGDLNTKLSALNTASITELAHSVAQLGQAMSIMNTIKTTDFTRLAKNLNSIGSVSGASISNASTNILQFTSALQSLNGISISQSAQQIANLGSSIRAFGLKSAQNAIANIPLLADSLKKLMVTLSTAPKVSRNVIELTNALAQLASANGRITGATTTAQTKNFFDTLTRGSNNSAKSIKSLAYYFGKMYANFFILFRLFHKLGEAIDLSSKLTELQNVVDVTFGNLAYKLDDLAKKSIEQFGMSELTVKQIGARFQAMGSAMGISSNAVKKSTEYLSKQGAIYDKTSNSMADMSTELIKLTADMASFYDVSQNDVADDLASIFTGATRPLRQYGLDLTQATLKEWALSQGLEADIKNMTQAEKAMLRYQYVMAHTTNAMGDFARTSNTWANQVRILKQNFQQLAIIIGNTLVNAFKPVVQALNVAMSKIIAFAQTVYNALGKIFGWQVEISSGGGVKDELGGAVDEVDDLGGGLDDASKKAKKLKDNLLGIDELNIISPDNNDDGSGSSGSGSGVGGDFDAGGAEVAIKKTEGMFESFIDDLYGLGEYIRDALIGAMESIDWDSVYEKARGFGKGLAQFLNGLLAFDGEGRTLFGEVGKTLANTLNAIVYSAQAFAEEFDFSQLGYNIADGINNFFSNFDFKALADTLNKWVDGIWDMATTAFENLDYTTIFNGLKTFFNELDGDTIVAIIGVATLKKFGNSIKEAIKLSIVTALKNTFKLKISDWGVIFRDFVPPEALALLLNTIVDKISGSHLDPFMWDGFIGDIFRYFADTWNRLFEVIIFPFFENPKETFGKAFKALFNWDTTIHFFELAKEWFSNIKDDFANNDWASIGNDIIEGIVFGISGAISLVFEPITDFYNKVYEKICEVFDIHSPAKKMYPLGENIFLGIVEGFKSKFDEFTTAIQEFWDNYIAPWFSYDTWYELFQEVQNALSDKWNEIVEWWNNSAIVVWWTENVEPWFTYDKWYGIYKNIKTSIKDIWDATVKQWGIDIKKWWDNDVEPWFTYDKWYGIFVNIEDSIKDAFKNAVNFAIDQLNNAIGAIENFINTALQGLKDFVSQLGMLGQAISLNISPISLPRIPHFATGGFPEDGLFFANHNELVGSFNGRNAVVNNEQIVEGISSAVARVIEDRLIPYMEEMVETNREIASKDTSIELDGRELVSAIQVRTARNGFAF